jgi:hypothetical protein
MSEQLTIFCEGCGTLNEKATREVNALIQLKDETIADLNGEVNKKIAQIRRMKGERNSQRELDPLYAQCVQVFDYWRMKLAPNAREFDDARWRAVHARLSAGHTVDDLKKAIDGCALKPYVVDGRGRQAKGSPDQRQADLELICRSEKNVRRFQSYVDVAAALKPRDDHDDLFDAEHVRAMRRDLRPAYGRLQDLRGWTPEVMDELGLGLREGRVAFFGRDADGVITGVSKYQPNPAKRKGTSKMLGEGSRELFPRPEDFDTSSIWLVEGEPDAVAMRVIGFPAVAVPGVSTWKEGWADRFEEFSTVYIAFDCDQQGRDAAEIRQGQLGKVTEARVVDIASDETDGYDISNLLLDYGPKSASAKLAALAGSAPVGTVAPLRQPDEFSDPRRPFEKIIDALDARDCRPRGSGQKRTAHCPAHDDRNASLVVTEGDDGRVLVHCHTGCTFDEVVHACGLEAGAMFPKAEGWS